HYIPVLPAVTTELGAICISHGHWTAISAAFVGAAVVLRHRITFWRPLCLVGICISIADHFSHNFYSAYGGGRHPNVIAEAMLLLAGKGWLALLIFFLCLAAAMAIDLWIIGGAKTRPAIGNLFDQFLSCFQSGKWSETCNQRRVRFSEFAAQTDLSSDKL
ncbi:MAG: hypothetical protein ACRD3W_24735, partial [Terriglobales bacterium]